MPVLRKVNQIQKQELTPLNDEFASLVSLIRWRTQGGYTQKAGREAGPDRWHDQTRLVARQWNGGDRYS